VITEGILDKITDKSQILSFELNEAMYQDALESLPEDDRLQLLNESALEFDKILKEQEIEKVDYFVSSLPLSLLKKTDIHYLMSKVTGLLSYGGMFIWFHPFKFPPCFHLLLYDVRLIFSCKWLDNRLKKEELRVGHLKGVRHVSQAALFLFLPII